MELLSFVKLDKGETASSTQFKSRNKSWFNQKHKTTPKEGVNYRNEDLYIICDSLIQVKFKRESPDTVEFYWAIVIFTKYNNK